MGARALGWRHEPVKGEFMSSNVKTAVFWVVIICAVVLVYMAVKTGRGPTPQNLNASQFVAAIQDGKVKEANITGTDVQGTLMDGRPFHTVIPPNYPDIYKLMQEKNTTYSWKDSTGSGWVSMLFNAVPILILLGLWIFMMRQMQSGGNKALSFGKSRARFTPRSRRKSHSKT